MHQVQLAVTQMFDGVTQVLWEDMPLRCGFGCGLRGTVRSAGCDLSSEPSGPRWQCRKDEMALHFLRAYLSTAKALPACIFPSVNRTSHLFLPRAI